MNEIIGLTIIAPENNFLFAGRKLTYFKMSLSFIVTLIHDVSETAAHPPNGVSFNYIYYIFINEYFYKVFHCFFAAINGQCGELGCVYYNNNYIGWEKNGIGRILIFLTLQGIVYFAILLFVESNLFKTIIYFFKSGKTEDNSETSISETTPLLQGGRVFVAHQPRQYQSSQIQEDSDVAAERGRLHMSKVLTDSLILKEVTKYYGQHLAVNHISVGIPQGECFGLLGVNGAGKTTTFKMLTGDEIMTTGEAYLNGQSVKSELAMVNI